MAGDENKKKLRLMYGRAFTSSLSNSMITPFIYVYAARIGASPGEIGWMHSFNNLFLSSLQVPWGRLSDMLGRRVGIIVVTSIAASLTWIPMALTAEPKIFLALVALYFFLSSAAVPAWNALLRETTQPSSRSLVVSNMNIASLLGSLFATAFSGWLIDYSGGSLLAPSVIAVSVSLPGSIILLRIKEGRIRETSFKSIISAFRISDIPSLINESVDFKLFLKISAFQGFFMSYAWPLFTITTATILNLSMTEVGAISVIQTIATLIAQPLMGRLATLKGKKRLMVIYYVSLTAVPLAYCFAQSFLHLAILSVYLGIMLAAGNATILPYILDIIPEDRVGELTSIYNMITGISHFMGSAVGGNMDELMSLYFGRQASLQTGYFVSAAGRLASGFFFLKINEKPSARRADKRLSLHNRL
ncbi:MAG: MFS transporter [Thermoproteota archaeon]|nr:MFS transporter [Candidatus Brockarchaeota archaeon]